MAAPASGGEQVKIKITVNQIKNKSIKILESSANPRKGLPLN
jgi:hypothetical protein